ncbi:hypothetical protein CDD83_9792 [Cordyceps sp. RAO-2017]|nr:hypothetical protein CDD83_9792 [Cordyceps sp. RAO-2017]
MVLCTRLSPPLRPQLYYCLVSSRSTHSTFRLSLFFSASLSVSPSSLPPHPPPLSRPLPLVLPAAASSPSVRLVSGRLPLLLSSVTANPVVLGLLTASAARVRPKLFIDQPPPACLVPSSARPGQNWQRKRPCPGVRSRDSLPAAACLPPLDRRPASQQPPLSSRLTPQGPLPRRPALRLGQALAAYRAPDSPRPRLQQHRAVDRFLCPLLHTYKAPRAYARHRRGPVGRQVDRPSHRAV